MAGRVHHSHHHHHGAAAATARSLRREKTRDGSGQSVSKDTDNNSNHSYHLYQPHHQSHYAGSLSLLSTSLTPPHARSRSYFGNTSVESGSRQVVLPMKPSGECAVRRCSLHVDARVSLQKQ
jgi:hypothetical protein